jgi:hypothetical protein
VREGISRVPCMVPTGPARIGQRFWTRPVCRVQTDCETIYLRHELLTPHRRIGGNQVINGGCTSWVPEPKW